MFFFVKIRVMEYCVCVRAFGNSRRVFDLVPKESRVSCGGGSGYKRRNGKLKAAKGWLIPCCAQIFPCISHCLFAIVSGIRVYFDRLIK